MQLHIITESSQLNIMMWMIKLKMDDIYKSILTRSFKIQTILLIWNRTCREMYIVIDASRM